MDENPCRDIVMTGYRDDAFRAAYANLIGFAQVMQQQWEDHEAELTASTNVEITTREMWHARYTAEAYATAIKILERDLKARGYE